MRKTITHVVEQKGMFKMRNQKTNERNKNEKSENKYKRKREK